jgi:hypothetical protein
MLRYLKGVLVLAGIVGLFLLVGLWLLGSFTPRPFPWWLWLILPVLGPVVVVAEELFGEILGAGLRRIRPIARLGESVEAATAGQRFSILRIMFGVAVTLPVFVVVVIVWNALKVLVGGHI